MTIPIPSQPGVRIAVDRGGTFTDIYGSIPRSSWPSPSDELIGNATIIPASSDDDDRVQVNLKLLSVDPQNYSDAPAEGIRRIMSMIRGRALPRDEKIDTTGVDFVRMGTTVATNALLERKGVPFGLLITRGFTDLLEVGDQKRPDLFDLSISNKAKMLNDRDHVIDVKEGDP
jgi:5-oxoprolinase (ATP-hydrolysing)